MRFMRKIIFRTILLSTTSIVILWPIQKLKAASSTPDFWKCYNRSNGQWGQWGQLPYFCDAEPFIDLSYATSNFNKLTYKDINGTTEKKRYLTEVNATLRSAANYYIRLRKPDVVEAEVEGWEKAVLAVAQQETWWSHYRVPSNKRYQYMRGDSGHGHGLMQVDDRHHFNAIKEGRGSNLVYNLIYAFDIYYAGWESSKKASCIKRESDYKARARSAYSAYNGGPSKICRWTNSKDRWAQNDVGFLQKYDKQEWLNLVSDFHAASSVDIKCIMDGMQNCAVKPIDTEPVLDMEPGKVYQVDESAICILSNAKVECVHSAKDVSCLTALDPSSFGNYDGQIIKTNTAQEELKVNDRHDLCASTIPGLFIEGSVITLGKNINLRKEPAGTLISVIAKGTKVQVLGFELKNPLAQDRYYLVRTGNTEGYVYAGSKSDYAAWATRSSGIAKSSKVIAEINDLVEIKLAEGVLLKDSIGGEVVRRLNQGEVVKVAGIKVKGDNGEIYYQVTTTSGEKGYIYSGSLLPIDTIDDWTMIK